MQADQVINQLSTRIAQLEQKLGERQPVARAPFDRRGMGDRRARPDRRGN